MILAVQVHIRPDNGLTMRAVEQYTPPVVTQCHDDATVESIFATALNDPFHRDLLVNELGIPFDILRKAVVTKGILHDKLTLSPVVNPAFTVKSALRTMGSAFLVVEIAAKSSYKTRSIIPAQKQTHIMETEQGSHTYEVHTKVVKKSPETPSPPTPSKSSGPSDGSATERENNIPPATMGLITSVRTSRQISSNPSPELQPPELPDLQRGIALASASSNDDTASEREGKNLLPTDTASDGRADLKQPFGTPLELKFNAEENSSFADTLAENDVELSDAPSVDHLRDSASASPATPSVQLPDPHASNAEEKDASPPSIMSEQAPQSSNLSMSTVEHTSPASATASVTPNSTPPRKEAKKPGLSPATVGAGSSTVVERVPAGSPPIISPPKKKPVVQPSESDAVATSKKAKPPVVTTRQKREKRAARIGTSGNGNTAPANELRKKMSSSGTAGKSGSGTRKAVVAATGVGTAATATAVASKKADTSKRSAPSVRTRPSNSGGTTTNNNGSRNTQYGSPTVPTRTRMSPTVGMQPSYMGHGNSSPEATNGGMIGGTDNDGTGYMKRSQEVQTGTSGNIGIAKSSPIGIGSPRKTNQMNNYDTVTWPVYGSPTMQPQVCQYNSQAGAAPYGSQQPGSFISPSGVNGYGLPSQSGMFGGQMQTPYGNYAAYGAQGNGYGPQTPGGNYGMHS